MSSIELKVKAKHLTAEARIIRREERKCLKSGRYLLQRQKDATKQYSDLHSLRDHRKGSLRDEARATHIAHALLKGVAYSSIENPRPDNPPKWERVKKMLSRYGYSRGKEIFESLEV